MTTFDAIILKCPHCKTMMHDYELMSYTVHTSECFSDGKCFGIPHSDRFKICSECAREFWTEDARQERTDNDWEYIDRLPGTFDMDDLPWRFDDDRDDKIIGYYSNLIEQGFAAGDDQEMYLRTRLWWTINDLVRYLTEWNILSNPRHFFKILKHRKKVLRQFKSYEKLFSENLKRMIFLYIKNDEVEFLYLANMYREMENFSKAKDVLEQHPQKSGSAYKLLKKKIRKKEHLVFEWK